MNKPRLIDANKMLKDLTACKCFPKISYSLIDFQDLILTQPTAYNVDGVVEQLSEIEVYRNEYSETVECNIEPCRGMSCYECILDKAIEIVRKGGAVDDETMA